MIKLICRMNKVNNDTLYTVYADGAPWFCLIEDDADDLIKKNEVKGFETVETNFEYVEIYTF